MGERRVRIAPDANVMARAMAGDDPDQSARAKAELAAAETIALGTTMLCELVWVLARGYRVPAREIAVAIRRAIEAENVVVDRLAVEAGLAMLENGGDFADGAIAHEGRTLGAEVFVSFDRTAVRLSSASGQQARLPA